MIHLFLSVLLFTLAVLGLFHMVACPLGGRRQRRSDAADSTREVDRRAASMSSDDDLQTMLHEAIEFGVIPTGAALAQILERFQSLRSVADSVSVALPEEPQPTEKRTE